MQIAPDLSFQEWLELAPGIGNASRSIGFVVGDWLVYGQSAFGPEGESEKRVSSEAYQKAITATGLDLSTLLAKQRPAAWLTALRSVGGVYLISDTSNGKLYVGSAYGDGGIWDRWEDYAKNGHGGNKDLVELLQTEGKEHASKFQFSILEICDLLSTKDEVIARENHWMNVLLTRDFGYNN
jgi:hypothetical protein